MAIAQREIDISKLNKTSRRILAKTHRLIDWYRAYQPDQVSVALFPDDYRKLAADLSASKQDITQCTYRGYALTRAAV